jgi:hypothetical protein
MAHIAATNVAANNNCRLKRISFFARQGRLVALARSHLVPTYLLVAWPLRVDIAPATLMDWNPARHTRRAGQPMPLQFDQPAVSIPAMRRT